MEDAEYTRKSRGYTPTTKSVCEHYVTLERRLEGGDEDELRREFFRWLDGIIAHAKDEEADRINRAT